MPKFRRIIGSYSLFLILVDVALIADSRDDQRLDNRLARTSVIRD